MREKLSYGRVILDMMKVENLHILGTDLERDFETQTRIAGLPKPIREYKFHPTRNWRADFAWPEYKVMVECQGLTWVPGEGHTRGSQYEKDVEKHNEAVRLGWKVFWITTTMLENDPASFMEMLGEVMGIEAYENSIV